ncbi:MAG: branched-chain amino acid ABC transporter permease [Clostridia bacterium]|nr:branched-chain amino acid ABC transporter permease [Eubacteriales bacterium]NCC48012.1 branched-chain amino acid ABC transporter permease [Clostridia bacterium]
MNLKKFGTKTTRSHAITYGLVVLAFIFVQILDGTGTLTSSLRGQLVPICAYVVMAISLNLTVGILGELSLGHAGFMSLGAFSGVIISIALQERVASEPLRLLAALLIGAVIAGIFGFVVGVPALRLRGDYLAIVTLAFGEIIKNVINTLHVGIGPNGLRVSMTDQAALNLGEEGTVIIQGPMGAVGISKLATFTAGFILILVTLFIVLNLIYSRSGRAIMAVRDNRIAAESVGISITRYKLTAFIISAALAGAAGALYALNYSTVVARKFDFNTSILVLVFVVLGGIGNIRGSIIAAIVLTILPELLRAFNDYRMLIYAVILILVMLTSNNDQLRHLLGRITGVVRHGSKKRPNGEGATHV